MKPITIIIPLLAMLCGCGQREKYIDSADFKQLTIDALNRQNDWNGVVIKFRLEAIENRLKKLESSNTVELGHGLPLTGPTLRLVASPEDQRIYVLEVPDGFKLITLTNGQYALTPDWWIDGVKLIPVCGTNYGARIAQ